MIIRNISIMKYIARRYKRDFFHGSKVYGLQHSVKGIYNIFGHERPLRLLNTSVYICTNPVKIYAERSLFWISLTFIVYDKQIRVL